MRTKLFSAHLGTLSSCATWVGIVLFSTTSQPKRVSSDRGSGCCLLQEPVPGTRPFTPRNRFCSFLVSSPRPSLYAVSRKGILFMTVHSMIARRMRGPWKSLDLPFPPFLPISRRIRRGAALSVFHTAGGSCLGPTEVTTVSRFFGSSSLTERSLIFFWYRLSHLLDPSRGTLLCTLPRRSCM